MFGGFVLLPIIYRSNKKEITLFDETSDVNEKTVLLAPLFEEQTSIEFCVFQGPTREKTWYSLYNETGIGKTEATFKYSGSGSKINLTVLVGNSKLDPITDISAHLNELWKQEKYWQILGVKEWSENLDLARNIAVTRTFMDEPETHGTINAAHKKLLELQETVGSVSVDLNFSDATVYLDGVKKGSLPCNIRIPSGDHTIKIMQGNNEIYSKQINVKPKKTTKLQISLSDFSDMSAKQNQKIRSLENKITKLEDDLKRAEREKPVHVYSPAPKTALVLLPFLFVELFLSLVTGLELLHVQSFGFLDSVLGPLGGTSGLELVGGLFIFPIFTCSMLAVIGLLVRKPFGTQLAGAVGYLTSFASFPVALYAFVAQPLAVFMFASVIFSIGVTLWKLSKVAEN
jgi:hypothetical protein